jgi:hypothetical protein
MISFSSFGLAILVGSQKIKLCLNLSNKNYQTFTLDSFCGHVVCRVISVISHTFYISESDKNKATKRGNYYLKSYCIPLQPIESRISSSCNLT